MGAEYAANTKKYLARRQKLWHNGLADNSAKNAAVSKWS